MIAVGSAGRFVAWIDARTGTPQVFVALNNSVGWQELAGSASATGISGMLVPTGGAASRPSITLDAGGLPIVSWTQSVGANTDVFVARYDSLANAGTGAWVALDTSLGTGGISATGLASSAKIAMTSTGPVVAWLDATGGVISVYAKRFESGAWVPLGTGASSATGVSLSATSVRELAIASDGTRVAVGWTQTIGARTQIYAREFSGSAWAAIGGSTTGNGLSNTTGSASAVSLAYSNGSLNAAWQDNTSGRNEIYAAKVVANQWVDAGTNSRSGGGVSATSGSATSPQLAEGGSKLLLIWLDDRAAARVGNSTAIYSKVWNGTEFVEELPGDASGRGLGSEILVPRSPASSLDSAGHPFVVWADLASGKSEVYLRGNTFDVATIHYINDADLDRSAVAANTLVAAPGNDARDGLTRNSPKRSLRGVLEDPARPLNPGDVIFVEAGSYDGGQLGGLAASGVLVLGSAGEPATINGSLYVNSSNNLTLTRLTLAGGVRVGQAVTTTIVSNDILGDGVTLAGGSAGLVSRNKIFPNATGIALVGNTTTPVIRANTIRGGQRGIAVIGNNTAATATSAAVIRSNRIFGATQGLSIEAVGDGRISNNRVNQAFVGINLIANFSGLITGNEVARANTGVYYGVPALLDNNRIHDGTVGIVTIVNSTSGGLGYFGSTLSNQIDRNATGVELRAAVIQNQRIFANTSGIIGTGSVSPLNYDHANLIARNAVGVDIVGPVTFNRISRNAVGTKPRSGQLVAHNVFDDNAVGASIANLSDVRLVNNTFVTIAGDNVRVTAGSREIELRSNVLSTDAGYDIYVDNASTKGFASDYNTLNSSGTGKLVYWTRDFTDILDWQEDVHAFDLNSIGTTVVDPLAARPSFVSRSLGDFRVFDLTARQRRTSPSVDAGDFRTDQGLPVGTVNLLSNPSFEVGLNGWSVSPSGTTKTASPGPFDGANYFAADSNPTTTLTQTVDLIAAGYLPAAIDARAYRTTFGVRARSAAEAPVDRGALTVTILNDASVAIGSPIIIQAANMTERWELIGESVALPAGARRIVFRYDAIRQSGTSNDVYLDNAFLQLAPLASGVDVGVRGNTAAESDMPAHLRLVSPDLYQDWERNKSIDIRWDSFGNTVNSLVAIDLMQDSPAGPVLVTSITTGTPDNGVYTWIAGNSGVDFGTKGLRIQISLATNRTVFDRSSETFAIPENTNTFFVNDAFVVGDQYTSVIGNNRNTGKLATAPKPYPNNVMRIYSLGANQTLLIDAGAYALLNPLLISNILGTGDDEGFVMQGSTTGATALRHANPFTVAPVVDLNNADFMTLRNMTLTGGTLGLFVHNQSTNLSASYVSAVANSSGGFRIDTGSTALGLDHLRSDQNSGAGIYINGLVASLTDSVASNNLGHGLQLVDTGATAIEGNSVFNNSGNGIFGVFASNTLGGSPLVIGNATISLGRGNVIHDNSPQGIYASGNVSIAGNTVYNHGIGIYLVNGATGSRNVVFDNSQGVYSIGGALTENRIYHNSDAGIAADGDVSITHNVIYSNGTGVRGNFAFNGTLTDNIIYANSLFGFYVSTASYYGGATTLVNNTFVQPTGDAIRALSNSKNLRLRNNVLWVSSGYGLYVAPDSQTGFQSDYNDFYVTGNGQVALWQNVSRPTLAAWRTTAFTDANSLSVDPRFVDLDGADNLLGYVSRTVDGRDDDFHLLSQYGSYHGVALAPVTAGSGTGAPMELAFAGNPTIDAMTSPLIDRGDANDSFALEPLPNGGFINIGAYGGTLQASISPARYVTVITPDGGEVWPQGQTFSIRWRSKYDTVVGGTFTIELVGSDTLTPILTIATAASATGNFNWAVPADLTPADYRIRVTRNDFPTVFDLSGSSFQVTAPINSYYVNDGAIQAGDLTTAIGNDSTNSGLTASSPKASISGVLNSYVLKPGDTIYVDAGTYNLSTTLILNSAANGIRIVGYSSPAFPDRAAVIDRGNLNQNVIELQNADGVTLDHLTIRGGYIGVNANTTSDSDNLTISNSLIVGNQHFGVYLDTSNDFARLQSNSFDSTTTNYGMWLFGTDAIVSTNRFTGGFYESGTIRGARSSVSDNIFTNVRTGINVNNFSAAPADRVTVRNNNYTNVREVAIGVSSNTLVFGNQITGAGTGLSGGGEFRNNTVRDGATGISAGYLAVVEDNRVFHNTGVGLYLSANATNRNNRIYDNLIGVQTDLGYTGTVNNNLIYDNSGYGVLVSGTGYYGGTPTITNNTIIQKTGNAVQVSDSRAQNVLVKNNILQVAGEFAGYAIAVNSDSGRGFRSDYNVIHKTGSGKIGLWENREFTDNADWFYEVGLDEHSRFGDPQFVGLAGADGRLGYDHGIGLPATFYNTSDLSGPVAQRRLDPTINFLWSSGAPIAGVNADNFSIRWDGFVYVPAAGSYTFYTQADDGVRLYLDNGATPVIDQWNYVGFGERSYTTTFSAAGMHAIKVEMHETTGDAGIKLSWSSAAITKQIIPSDYLDASNTFTLNDFGDDDNFASQVTSNTIDGGDPNDAYFREPTPNGGRINIGAYGNTSLANTSLSQLVQILSPNGLEKFERGQAVSINFRSSGIKTAQPVMLLNAGSTTVDAWQSASPYLKVGAPYQFTNSVSLAGLVDPAPQSVYQSYFYGSGAANAPLSLRLPLVDGTYALRLHFVEMDYNAANQRKFDINLGGTTVRSNYDVFAASGGRYIAKTEEFSDVTVSGGSGLSVDLINKLGGGAVISAIEVFVNTPQGITDPQVSLDISSDGVSWLAMPGASNVPVDRWGRGSFSWTIPENFALGNNYQIRARSTGSTGLITDRSDSPFLVTNSGRDFFLNDNSAVADVFTTALGNNTNSGKSADQPIASLQALLAAYSFSSGDVIHVDSGNYRLIKTAVLTSRHAGVRIEGPTPALNSPPQVTLDRNNLAFNVIELQNADGVTLDGLTIRGGYNGVSAGTTSDSDNLTISHSLIAGNQQFGVFLDSSNDSPSFLGNTFDSTSSNYGMGLFGTDAVISTNRFTGGFYESGTVRGARSSITNNIFTNVRNGLGVNNYSSIFADRTTVQNNIYTNVRETAISASVNTLVTGNQISGAGTGLAGSGEFRNNVVRDGTTGISASYLAVVEDNRVFHNTGVGLYLSSNATNRNNRIYDNGIGVQTDLGYSGVVSNNILYNNSTYGVLVSGTGYYGGIPTIVNNTIIQKTGNAIQLNDGRAQNVLVKNNILQVSGDYAGYAISISPDAGRGFRSDYNTIYTTGNGKIALWENHEFTDRSDWFYEVGMDEHSSFGDPKFAGLSGADGRLGFGRGGGLPASYYNTADLTGPAALTRLDEAINFNWNSGAPGVGLNSDNFSVRWNGYLYVPSAGTYSFYTQADDGVRLYFDDIATPVIDQWSYVGFAERTYTTTFATPGMHAIKVEMRETTGTAAVRLSWSSAAITKQIIPSDYLGATNTFVLEDFGADDNFALQLNSPTLDAGDPNDLYFLEPMPNGARVNVGAYGNSTLASVSPSQLVQILSPHGLEKVEQGQMIPIKFHSAGQRTSQPIALLNGGPVSGLWAAASPYLSMGNLDSNVYEMRGLTIDRSAVINPIPEELYHSYAYANGGVGSKLALAVQVPDGLYSVRLHFVEPSASINQRVFDIRVNGITVRAGYDIRLAAGDVRKAIAETFSGLRASGGTGLSIELANVGSSSALLSAIEVFANTPQGTSLPKVALDVSGDDGASWSPITTDLAVDRWGNGSFDWLVPATTPIGNNYRVRARSTSFSSLFATSDATFSIAGGGPNYYVSPSGDNHNSGKLSSEPMRSISGLINAYDLDSGDIVNLAAGTYRTYRNIVITAQDNGVTLLGLTNTPSIIERGNTYPASYSIELQNADGVVIDALRISGGEVGLFAGENSDADGLTVRNSQLYGNAYSGLWIGSGNDSWTLENNKIYGLPGGSTADDQSFGIFFNYSTISVGYQILNNEIYDHVSYGIFGPRSQTLISGNDIHGNRYGISANFGLVAGSQPLVIRDNRIHDNTEYGLYADSGNSSAGSIIVNNNRISGQVGDNDVGLYAYNGTQAFGNEVYGNFKGIVTTSSNSVLPSSIHTNRLFGNRNAAVTADGNAQVFGNYIYSNSIGVQAISSFNGTVASNLVYSNTNRGLLIQNSSNGLAAQYLNNTVYQPVGDGIRVEGSARNNRILNNIVWVLAGYGLYVDNNSQVGLTSDYNHFFQGADPNAYVGYWNGAPRNLLADWKAASAVDLNSVEGNPSFVDIDGADNVLGFVANVNGGIDGGLDDNFYRNKNSLSTDRGHSWDAAVIDIEGFNRLDDPATVNFGGPRYTLGNAASLNLTGGVAQNWKSDDNYWTWTLPFAFSLYGTSYATAYVSSNGFIQFGNNVLAYEGANSTEKLAAYPRVAPLWDDLTTSGATDNIYIDTSTIGQATVRWDATNKANSGKASFSATLFADGRVQFDYGDSNLGLTPTVGISRGNTRQYELVSGYDGAVSLASKPSTQFSTIPGITDMGAYEFRGDSGDATPPQVVSSNPSSIQANGVVAAPVGEVRLIFSEEINPIDARSPAAYELRGAGANGLFNDSDDILFVLQPSYSAGQNTVVLTAAAATGPLPGGSLPVGVYRVTVFAGVDAAIHDLSGNRLDGASVGVEGGNYVRTFNVIANVAPTLLGANPLTSILQNEPDASNPGTLISQLLQGQVTDPDGPSQGIAVRQATSSAGTWQYALDGVNFLPVVPKLTAGKLLLLAADSNTRVRFQPNTGYFGTANDLVFSAWDTADELLEGTDVLPSLLAARSLSATSASASIAVIKRVNLRPVIGAFDTAITYTENGSPLRLDTNATVSDVDSPNFDTGKLTITLTANRQVTDVISIVTGGVGATSVSTTGSQVSVGGVLMGTFAGGTNNAALVVTLNDAATPLRTQTLLRAIAFRSTSENPSQLPRTVRVMLTDGDGGTSIAVSKTVNVLAVIDIPIIRAFDTAITYTENGIPLLLDIDATIVDVDSANFDTGQLTVQLAANGQTTDIISIKPRGIGANAVTINANQVSVGGTVVGSFSGGTNNTPFVVLLNVSATPALVQTFLRAIAFSSSSENPSILPRTVRVTLNDGDGGTSAPVTKTVNVLAVNDAPVVGAFDTAISYTRGGSPLLLDIDATVSDVDATNFNAGKLTVSVSVNRQLSDVISILVGGSGTLQVSISGQTVLVGGVAIGTYTGGSNGSALVVSLNTAATADRVQSLLRAIAFSNTSSQSVLARTVRVTLTDGVGGTSLPVNKTVNIL